MSKKNILVISYFAGQKGFSPAEWLDDKINALSQLGHRTTLVSCISSKKVTEQTVEHFRVPSLSLVDFKIEFSELKKTQQKIPFYMYFFFPIAYSFGYIFDRLFIIATKGLGGGKLSWAITSFFTAIYILCTQKIDIIFSTGGAASSHLTAAVTGLIFRKPVIIELQDPLYGHGIGRTSKSAKLLMILEKFLIKTSKKVVYVTKQAADEAKQRWHCNNAVCIYPGSRNFNIKQNPEKRTQFRFLHLGTLYSTRNFNTLVAAIDNLIESKKISSDEIELINLGDIYGDYLTDYQKKTYFKQYPIRPRAEAIAFAAQSDVNLIVQHSDPRSTTTIPYKTYDYFNLDCQILGLTNNKELSDMLVQNGYQSVNINDVSEISEKVLKLIRKEIPFTPQKNRLNILKQMEILLA